MIKQQIELEIARPVSEVFVFVTDSGNHSRWDTSSEGMTPDRPGPWSAGLTFTEVRHLGPCRRVTFRSRVAALVPDQSFDIESVSGPEFHGHWRFAATPIGTRLRWSCEMVPDTPRLLQPLVALAFRRSSSRNFARLKALLEAEDTPAGPGVQSRRG